MNAKRIVAIIIALLVLFASWMFSVSRIAKETSLLKDIATGSAQPSTQEEILEYGNQNQKIAVVDIIDVIEQGYDFDNIISSLETIRSDDKVKGVLLYIDSPGGGVYEAAQISDKIKQIKEETGIPFYASMGSLCASGGYYIAANCDRIFAAKETMTGSIGVINSGLNFSGFFQKYGISEDVIKSGKYKDIGSSSREMTDDERKIMQELIDSSYDEFLNIVANGRKLDKEYVRSLADGRIYDGRQALKNKLIDEIGYYEDTLDALKTELNIKNPTVVDYQYNDRFYGLQRFFGSTMENIGKSSLQKEIDAVRSVINTPSRPMYMYGGK